MNRSDGSLASLRSVTADEQPSGTTPAPSEIKNDVDGSVFDEIVRRCLGMLPPAVYKKIYDFGLQGGLIVEVGTALGAGTAALAMGLRDSGKPGRVVSFDPMTGGPLRKVSDASDRAQLVKSNLEYFGVADLVEVVTESLPDGIARLGADEPISVFMIDADGRLDRDLIAVAPRLGKGTRLIIDDIGDKLRLTERKGTRLKVDQKMRLAFLLLRKFQRDGLISEGVLIKETYFGEVLQSAPEIRLEDVLETYRELVFGYTHWRYSDRARRYVVKWMERNTPRILQRARVLYRNARTSS